jgi:hypothetical protein
MMSNRIIRLSTVAFSFFLMTISYAVRVEAQDSKAVRSKTQKSKTPKSAAKSKAMKKSLRKGSATANLGKFDGTGDIKSFDAAAGRVEDYIKNKLTAPDVTKADKYDIYKSILVFVKTVGRPKFATDEHYKVVKGLLDTAVANGDKFNIKAVAKGLKKQQTQFEKEMNSPAMREKKNAKGVKIAAKRTEKKTAKKVTKAKRVEKAKAKATAKSKVTPKSTDKVEAKPKTKAKSKKATTAKSKAKSKAQPKSKKPEAIDA